VAESSEADWSLRSDLSNSILRNSEDNNVVRVKRSIVLRHHTITRVPVVIEDGFTGSVMILPRRATEYCLKIAVGHSIVNSNKGEVSLFITNVLRAPVTLKHSLIIGHYQEISEDQILA